jgi:epidermal growth factor receptor substrate 15
LGSIAFPNAFPVQQQAPSWDVTAQEKDSFDGFFTTLDTQNKGFIEGDVAVPFLVQSGLPDEALAQVW